MGAAAPLFSRVRIGRHRSGAGELRLTRPELFDRVWSTLISQLAGEWGLLDQCLAKVCRRLKIPRPPCSYWARRQAGRGGRRGLPRRSERLIVDPRLRTSTVKHDAQPDPHTRGRMAETLIRHLQTLARYNRLANNLLYEACAKVGDEARRAPRSASFGTIHGALSHVLKADRIWMARFEGGQALSTGLTEVLYEDFRELREARGAEDGRIERFFVGVEEKIFEQTIRYVNNQGRTLSDPVPLLVAHFFNHQTHHRGQIHVMLREAGATGLILDMHRLIRP